MKNKLKLLLIFICLIQLITCGNNSENYDEPNGSIERISGELDSIIDAHAKVEIIAKGTDWAEGPLWVESERMLLFSDVPQNMVYKWTETNGMEKYLMPSGYTSTISRGGEIGSNGLTLDNEGRLVLCQDGNRQIAYMDAPLSNPKAVFKNIANNFNGKKFNSPNDLVYNGEGELFFTDPPYGLEKGMEDPLKEIQFQGVYKVKKQGEVILLTDTIKRPNGIALTPDEKTLLIANSDPNKPYLYAYDLNGDSLTNARVYYDFTEAYKTDPRNPDGLTIDKKGNVYSTGPGGVWIFDKNGKVLGKIKFPTDTSNCTLSSDEKILFITADMFVLRIKLRK
jgi:gluconolactonase